MEMPQVRKAAAAELDKVLHTVTLAFSADPLMRRIPLVTPMIRRAR